MAEATTVLRLERLHAWNQVTKASDHDTRKRQPKNADPARGHLNRLLVACPSENVAEYCRAKINPDRKIRADAVLTLTGIMSAGAAYFRPDNPGEAGAYDPARLEPWVQASMGFLAKKYGDRIVQAALHLDEVTPHIHFLLLPLDSRGHLSCKTIIGGPKQVSQLQTEYHQAVKHLGISRGVQGSTATHQTVRQVYGILNQPAPALPAADDFREDPPAVLRTSQNIKAWAAREKAAQAEEVRGYFQALLARAKFAERQAREAQAAAEAERKRAALLKIEAREFEEMRAKVRRMADEVRDLDLAQVLQAMFQAQAIGQDSRGRERFQLPDGETVSVSGQTWEAEQGRGRGAINLMLYLAYESDQAKFQQAVRDLAEVFGDQATSRALAGHLVRTATNRVKAIRQQVAPAPEATAAAARRRQAEARRPKKDQRPVFGPAM